MNCLVEWNERFGIADQLAIVAGPGGLPVIEIDNAAATAAIALHGAHVLRYRPVGARPVLWLSSQSMFAPGKPIRGGIPICWPWFGAHPENAAAPAHGFARIMDWELVRTERVDEATTRVRLQLRDSPATHRWWEGAFLLTLEVTVGTTLDVALRMDNTGERPWTVTAALHSYFAVGDVRRVAVHGFEGCPSINTVGGQWVKGRRETALTVDRETDEILLECPGEAWMDDPVWRRRIGIRKEGSTSAVVWNPWIDKARRMPDFGDEEYPEMMCVETCNAPGDEREVEAGGSHCLRANIRLEQEAR